MGLFDIFKSGPSKEAILSQVTKAKEVYAQPDYRRMAMDKLLKWATPESYEGLLERFCVVVQSPHWDEEEKRWLVDEMVKIGDGVLPILKNFILKKNEVNHALLAYRKIAGDEKYHEMLKLALNARPPSDHRSIQAKQELISALSENPKPELKNVVLPYLDDHSDDVQCASIEVLAKIDDREVNDRLLDLLKSETHSARVLRAAAMVVANKKIPVQDAVLADEVKEDFRIDSGYLVRI